MARSSTLASSRRRQVVDVEKVTGHVVGYLQAVAEDVNGLVDLGFADQERGGQAEGAVGDGVDDQALLQAGGGHRAGPAPDSSAPSSSPRPRTVRTEGSAVNFFGR